MKKLFRPKCFSSKVQPTFSIGKERRPNIIYSCGYEGLALKEEPEIIEGMKGF